MTSGERRRQIRPAPSDPGPRPAGERASAVPLPPAHARAGLFAEPLPAGAADRLATAERDLGQDFDAASRQSAGRLGSQTHRL